MENESRAKTASGQRERQCAKTGRASWTYEAENGGRENRKRKCTCSAVWDAALTGARRRDADKTANRRDAPRTGPASFWG